MMAAGHCQLSYYASSFYTQFLYFKLFCHAQVINFFLYLTNSSVQQELMPILALMAASLKSGQLQLTDISAFD